MNYYERHIGDYIRDTVGLSMLEDGAYGRLLDQLYQTEKPLPLDRKEVYRMARATSTPERKAVDYVVGKFFEKTDEGYVQKRAMEILAEYWDRPEQADKKNTKEGNRERQRKSRERRKALFEALAGHGVVPRYDTPMRELEAMLSRCMSQEKRDKSHPVTHESVTPVMAPVMGNHSPLPTTQTKPSAPSQVVVDPAQHVGETPSAAAEVSTALIAWERARGKVPRGIFAGDAKVQELAALAPSPAELRQAYDLAVADRDATGDATPINAGFVLTMLGKVRNPPKPRQRSLGQLTDIELEAEAQRVGAHTHGKSRDQAIAAIQAKRKQLEAAAA